MAKDIEKNPQSCSSGLEEEEEEESSSSRSCTVRQTKDQSGVGIVKGKLPISFDVYILLFFAGCFILFPQLDGIN